VRGFSRRFAMRTNSNRFFRLLVVYHSADFFNRIILSLMLRIRKVRIEKRTFQHFFSVRAKLRGVFVCTGNQVALDTRCANTVSTAKKETVASLFIILFLSGTSNFRYLLCS
jgi:hypothetical protein